MNWCIKSIALMMFLSNAANAGNSPIETIADACLKDDKLEICRNLQKTKDYTEKTVNDKLTQWGLANAAIFTGTMLQYAATGKFQYKNNSNSVVLGRERTITVDQHGSVIITIVWPMEW